MPSDLKSRWPQIATATHQALGSAVMQGGQEMRRRLIAAMHESKHGRVYDGHVASAPGEPPASWSGATERTIEVVKINDTTVAVQSNSIVSVVQEFGSSKQAPRPNWTPRAEEMKKELPGMIAGELRKAVR